jgi:hypothetical protein
LRPQCTGGFELEVHEILSATVRAEEVNANLHAHTENTGAGKSVESDDVAVDDDETQRDQVTAQIFTRATGAGKSVESDDVAVDDDETQHDQVTAQIFTRACRFSRS